MFAVQLVLMLAISIALIAGYFFLKSKKGNINKWVYVICSSVLAVVFFFRYMWKNDVIHDSFMLTNWELDTSFEVFVSLITNWLLVAIILLVCLYPIFKKTKIYVIIKYFALPVAILCMVAIKPLTIGIIGRNGYAGWDIRAVLIAIELALVLSVSFVVFMENGKFKTKKKDLLVLLYIIGALLATMPAHMLEGLFGSCISGVEIKSLEEPHRMIVYLSIVIPIVIYAILRKKDKEVIRLSLLYICLGTLVSFCANFRFPDFVHLTSWPIHLCHTAMFILPLCLFFKWNKIFYFTYFINVLGAFLANVMPGYSVANDFFYEGLVEFYINHYIAFFMPILIVMLKVYPRPRIREFKYSMIGFCLYFVLVLILNAWFSNYGTCDYFYLNSDFVVDKLGKWAERTQEFIWSFNIGDLTFQFYPIYQAIFFGCYIAMGAGVWFLYESMYLFEDTIVDILERKKKIKADALALAVALGERGKGEPMNKEGENKLIIRNFSKRYGHSDVYAVKDANLEINGGEIFGFLGHNGAGKSTIIKSIVGIQPITSGNIEVCGYDVDKQSVEAKHNIGFVPDHYALYEKLTGREYINYIADLYGVSQEDRDKCIKKYVTLFELGEAFDNQIKTYSHGMKQKITIISALVHNPRVWILDEPLTGLDPTSIFQVKECMREHAKKGNIVFFSSHLIDIVESLCDRVAIIKKGHVLTCKSVAEIEKEMPLEEFYLRTTETRVSAVKYKEEDKPLTLAEQKELEKAEKQRKKQEKLKVKQEKANAKKQEKEKLKGAKEN